MSRAASPRPDRSPSPPPQARPYAVAVFAFARQNNTLREWSDTLRSVADAAGAVFAEIAGRALVPQPQLGEAILELAGHNLRNPESRNFVRILAENRRLELAGAVADMFEEFRRDSEGVEQVLVETAMPMHSASKSDLEAALQKRTGKKVQAEYRENPELLAGARIFIRDNVLDASAQGRLARLAAEMRR